MLGDLVQLGNDVRGLGVHIAYTVSWLREKNTLQRDFREEIEKLVEFTKSKYTLEGLKSDPVVRAYRDFYWRIGVDPTKTRPAGEALVRRALRGEFPRINPVVDAGNIASAYTLVPIGIYDLDKVKPPLRLVLSHGGEVFKPIGGHEEILPSGIPILVDNERRVIHIYPHRDSVETCVTSSTSKVVTIAAGVPRVNRNLVVKAVEIVVRFLHEIGWQSCESVIHKA